MTCTCDAARGIGPEISLGDISRCQDAIAQLVPERPGFATDTTTARVILVGDRLLFCASTEDERGPNRLTVLVASQPAGLVASLVRNTTVKRQGATWTIDAKFDIFSGPSTQGPLHPVVQGGKVTLTYERKSPLTLTSVKVMSGGLPLKTFLGCMQSSAFEVGIGLLLPEPTFWAILVGQALVKCAMWP